MGAGETDRDEPILIHATSSFKIDRAQSTSRRALCASLSTEIVNFLATFPDRELTLSKIMRATKINVDVVPHTSKQNFECAVENERH